MIAMLDPFHSYAFDFSVWEIWEPYSTDGKLVVVPYLTSRSPVPSTRSFGTGVTV